MLKLTATATAATLDAVKAASKAVKQADIKNIFMAERHAKIAARAATVAQQAATEAFELSEYDYIQAVIQALADAAAIAATEATEAAEAATAQGPMN